jgi:hypothetical protein
MVEVAIPGGEVNGLTVTNLATISEIISVVGYKAIVVDQESLIHSKANGLRFIISGDSISLQFSCGIAMDATRPPEKFFNDFNSELRFGGVHVDDEGDIVMDADFLFDVSDDQSKNAEKMKIMMDVWEGLLGQLKTRLNSLSDNQSL